MSLSKTILLVLKVFVAISVYSQKPCNNSLSGRVLEDNHLPIYGATVFLMPQQIGQVSDSLGRFRFDNLCEGYYTVRVQYLGYQDLSFKIFIKGSVTRTIRLTEIATELNEIVIEHHDALHTENANTYIRINEKQLAESAGKSLGESLKEISGVNTIQTGPGIFKPVIHGVHSQRVLILNHGIRHEGQQWGAEHAPEIDPFIASTIIVIKDASAIKYGADALGGVIIVNPPDLPAQAGLGGTFNTILQSNGRSATVSGMLEGGIRHQEGWGWRVQGTAKKAGDFHAARYNLTNTGLNELNFSAATGMHKENFGFDFFFSHFQSEIGILRGTSIENVSDLVTAMESSVPQFTENFSYKIGEPRQQASHKLLKLNGHVKTVYGEWRMQYGFQNDNRKEFDIRIGDLSKTPVINLQLNTHTLEAEWETTHSEKKTLSFGMNNIYQDNNNIRGTKRIPFLPNFNNVSTGIFGVVKFNLNAWSLNAGLRYDFRYYDVRGRNSNNELYHASYYFNNISATGGATAQLKLRQTISLNVSTSWRPPHVAELYSFGKHLSTGSNEYGLSLDPLTSTVNDIHRSNVKAEQALKFVSTYKREFKIFEVELSPYANYIFNYIYLRPQGLTVTTRGPAPALHYTQTNALFMGVDFWGTWHAYKYVQVIPRVSLLRASDERNHDYLVFIPPNRGELAIRFERPTISHFKNVYMESKASYVAKQTRAPRVISGKELASGTDPFTDDKSTFDFMAPSPAYWLWNLSAGTSIKKKNTQYDFRISSQNTLNKSYREYTNRFRYYADDLGRNITLSFKCIF